MTHLLPRFNRHLERRDRPTEPAHREPDVSTAGGDEQKLRGLPAIGRGVSGVIPGTDPFREAARRDNQRRRQQARVRAAGGQDTPA